MIPWKPEYDALLGTMSDQALADALGCPPAQVRVHRLELGIPPGGKRGPKPRDWPPEALELLGTAPDAELAELMGVPVAAVGNKRRALGRLRRRGPASSWTPERDALLGTMSDRKVAALLGGVSSQGVYTRRSRLGIPACHELRTNSHLRRWDEPALLEALATLRDTGVAAKFGITRERARQLRVKFGVPAPARPMPAAATAHPKRAVIVGRLPDGGYRVRCRCGNEYDIDRVQGPLKLCGKCPRGVGRRRHDWTGHHFPGTSLTATRRVDENSNSKWYFDCDCGTTDFAAIVANVQKGLTKSCGCLREEYFAFLKVKFGGFGDGPLPVWKSA